MRFNIDDYDKVFPRQEKPKPKKPVEESMIEEVVETPEEKEVEDGLGTDGKSDTE